MTTDREADLAAYARAGILLAEAVARHDAECETCPRHLVVALDRYLAALPDGPLAETAPGDES